MFSHSDCSSNTTVTGTRRARCWLPTIATLLVSFCGCPSADDGPPPSSKPSTPAAPVRLIVVDDKGLADAVDREWKARAEGEIKVRQMETKEVLEHGDRPLPADAIIYPSGLIGELASRDLITPIDEDVVNDKSVDDKELDRPRFARRDIFELIRQQDIVWGEQVYAVPLGSPTFVLFYRGDLLESLGEQPPASWAEYQQLAPRLAVRENLGQLAPSEDVPWHGVAEPLGPGWAGQTLLARAAGYARHRNYLSTLFDLYSMEPMIASPSFVRALEELVAAAKLAPDASVTYSPTDVRRELLAGHCAMAITWPSHGGGDGDAAEAETHSPLPIELVELPGSNEVYEPSDAEWQKREDPKAGRVTVMGIAGRLGSVTSSSRRPQAALDMLLRLSGTDWSVAVSPQSPATTLYRASQVQSAGSWIDKDFDAAVARDYAETVKQAFRRPLHLKSPRIPGRARYMAALDEAVHQAVQGDQTPEECLEAAAKRWQAITEELGVESQKAAYWRSLGMEP